MPDEHETPVYRTASQTAALLKRVWRDGAPDSETAYLRSLGAGRAHDALERLEAVLDVADRGNVGEAAKRIGMQRPGFFKMRRRWHSLRSLRALVPYETRPPRGPTLQAGLRRRIATATRILKTASVVRRNRDVALGVADREMLVLARARRLEPDMSDAAREELHAKLAAQAESAVVAARRRLTLDRDWLRGAFGTGLVVDMVAVPLAAEDAAGLRPAVVAVVMEAASGLIIGDAIGRLEDATALERRALERAIEFIREAGLADRPAGTPVDVVMILPPGSSSPPSEAQPEGFEIADPSRQPFGGALWQIQGGRIGRIPLMPRRTLKPSFDAIEITVGDDALVRATWSSAVHRHNVNSLDLLRAYGLAGGASSDGAMVATLLKARSLLAGDGMP